MVRLGFDEHLPLDRIDVSISNARKSNLEEGIEDLKNSIKQIGVQQPVVVFKKGDRFELIIGQRRYLACKQLGKKEIPALITTVKDDTDATIKSFSENIHRLDLEYRDKMQVATRLLKEFGSVEVVAGRLGVNPQTVRNYLGYAAVPDAIKEMVDIGKLSATTAIRIVKSIPDEDQAIRIAEKITETTRAHDRGDIIDIAKENPGKSAEEITRIFTQRSQMKWITIHITKRVYRALTSAAAKYESHKEDLAKEAIEEWLTKRDLLK